MFAGFAELTSILALSAGLVALASRDWTRLRSLQNPAAPTEFAGWVIRGWITPMFIWTAWNFAVFAGWLQGVIPLLPGVPLGPIDKSQLGDLVCHSAALVLFTVTTYWMAFTQIPLLAYVSKKEYDEDPRFWKILFGIFVFPIAAFVAWWLGPAGWGFAAAIVLWPVVQFLTLEPRKHVPAYGRAVARMKFGDYRQAEQEIILQLEKCEDDYEGWMLLAQLYAEQFGEIANATATIDDLCAQPGITPFQISRAYQRLADWYLAGPADPYAAKAALEIIVKRIPDTPFARSAQQRIATLPLDREELLEQREVKRLRLPSLSESPAPDSDSADEVPKLPVNSAIAARDSARRRLTRLNTRIEADPNDWSLREQKLILIAEELNEAAAAVRDLEERLAAGTVPVDRIPACLAHCAGWRLKQLNDRDGAKRILERLIREFPNTPQAYGASSQLWTMEQEVIAAQQVQRTVTAPRIVVRMPQNPSHA